MNIFTPAIKYAPEAINVIKAQNGKTDHFGWIWSGEAVDFDSAVNQLVDAIQVIAGETRSQVGVKIITGVEALRDYGMYVIPPRMQQKLAVVYVR